MPSVTTEPQRLLHIAHASQDQAWVRGVLVPALGLTEGQYWTRSEDELGAPKLAELERAVTACRYTLLVTSGAGRVDQWAQFGAELAQLLGVEEGKPRLLLVARDFAPGSEPARELLPLHQRCLVSFDCSDEQRTPRALEALAAQLALTTTETSRTECPYPGLRMFGDGDPSSMFNRTDLFFGRDREAGEILDKLRRDGRVLLVGPSGCGKSSLVRARVLGPLRHGADAMVISVARPGPRPDVALRTALDAIDPRVGAAIDAYLSSRDEPAARRTLEAAAGGPKRLLHVDQLEEVFVDGAERSGARAQFFARLAAAGRVPGMHILLGMRADFYGDLMRSPAWDDFKAHRVELAPLRGSALREAITRPAAAVGVHVEVDLVERLVREADRDRAAEALPLLQVALEQLWAYREWRYLSLASYRRLVGGAGTIDDERRGLDVVLAHHADATIDALDEVARVLARRVLIDLVQLGEGRPDTRRRCTVSELRRAGDDPTALARVLEELSARRLIAIGAESSAATAVQAVALSSTSVAAALAERHIDLAHDALITGWPALAGWIAERRDQLRTQRRLEARASGGLLAASELPEFTHWVAWIATPAGQALGASEALRALVRRSVAARQRFIGGVVAVIIALAVAAAIATWQRRIAVDNAAAARQQLARNYARSASLLAQTPGMGLASRVLALEAVLPELLAGRAPPPELYAGLGDALASYRSIVLGGHSARVLDGAWAPDGQSVATAGSDGILRVWDRASGRLLWSEAANTGELDCVVYGPDGTRLVTCGTTGATLWDPVGHRAIARLPGHSDAVASATFSSDGSRIATTDLAGLAQVWRAQDGGRVAELRGPKQWVRSAAFTPDGAQLVTASGDQAARVWDVATSKLVRELPHDDQVREVAMVPHHPLIATLDHGRVTLWPVAGGEPWRLEPTPGVTSIRFSPGGERFATAASDRLIRVYTTPLDAADAAHETPLLITSPVDVDDAVFSPDATYLVARSADGTSRVWTAFEGALVHELIGHRGQTMGARFSPDGAALLSVGVDATGRIWQLEQDLAMRDLGAGDTGERLGMITRARFSADGTRLFTTHTDGHARLWDPRDGHLLGTIGAHDSWMSDATLVDGGRALVTVGHDGLGGRWDVATGARRATLRGHRKEIYCVVPAPGDRTITGGGDATVRLWGADGTLIRTADSADGAIFDATPSPDGERVVTFGEGHRAQLWNARTLEAIATLPRPVTDAAFSPDGTAIATAANDGSVALWNGRTGAPARQVQPVMDELRTIGFTPDGALVVSGHDDGSLRIWSLPDLTLVRTIPAHRSQVTAVSFAPGLRVASGGNDGFARVFDLATGAALLGFHEPEPVRRVVVAPDGSRLVVVTADAAHLDTLDPADLAALACDDILPVAAIAVEDRDRVTATALCRRWLEVHPVAHRGAPPGAR